MHYDSDLIYRGGLGYPVDVDSRHLMVENGDLSGYDGTLDYSNGFEEQELSFEITDDRYGRLQEIEYELSLLLVETVPSEEDIEAVLMLEVEKTMLKEEIAMEVVAENPIDTEVLLTQLNNIEDHRADALKDYYVIHRMEQSLEGAPIDLEMYEEAKLLGTFIAQANPGETSAGLVKVARALKEAIDARLELNKVLTTV